MHRHLHTIIHHHKLKGGLYILGSAFLLYIAAPWILPVSLDEIPHSSIIYDKNHIEIGEIIYDGVHRHQTLPLEEYPSFLVDSMLQIEDRRFWTHHGIDIYGILRASKENIEAGAVVQGASTITSQIARSQLGLNTERTRWRKIIEFGYAYLLEGRYSKKELLSYYLNALPLGYLNYGFETAAQRYFGKSVTQLSKSQQVALISLAKNPVRYDPYKQADAFGKRYTLLSNLLLSGVQTDPKDLGWTQGKTISQPYFRDFVKQHLSPSQRTPEIVTSIDDNMSQYIQKIAEQTITKLRRKNVSDFGVLVIDRESNALRVMLGGMRYDGKYGQVNATTSINQPGSSVKPFTYALAFQELGLTPTDTIVDEPVQYQSAMGFAYTPQNFSMNYQGEVSLGSALAQSLNVPAVKLANRLGADKLLNFYHKVGLESLNKSADYYGLALTLGVGEVSLWEMARAYGIFAHQGKLCDIRYLSDQADQCHAVIDAKYTDMIINILSNRYLRMPTFPMYGNLDFPDRNVFLKSGTSRSFSDNWVLGFTDHYIIAVRVGNKDGSNMKGVSGASGGGDIFNNIVYYLESDAITPEYTAPNQTKTSPYLNIVKPLPDSLFKIDSTVASNLQGIKFQYASNIDHDKEVWTIDNQEIKGVWTPLVGKHTVSIRLYSGSQQIAEAHNNFEVK